MRNLFIFESCRLDRRELAKVRPSRMNLRLTGSEVNFSDLPLCNWKKEASAC